MTSAEYEADANKHSAEWALVYAVLSVAAAIREANEPKPVEPANQIVFNAPENLTTEHMREILDTMFSGVKLPSWKEGF